MQLQRLYHEAIEKQRIEAIKKHIGVELAIYQRFTVEDIWKHPSQSNILAI